MRFEYTSETPYSPFSLEDQLRWAGPLVRFESLAAGVKVYLLREIFPYEAHVGDVFETVYNCGPMVGRWVQIKLSHKPRPNRPPEMCHEFTYTYEYFAQEITADQMKNFNRNHGRFLFGKLFAEIFLA